MNENQTSDEPYLKGIPIETFLDHLPILAGCCVGRKLSKEASDGELQAWAWGIEDATENVRVLIRQWREANAE